MDNANNTTKPEVITDELGHLGRFYSLMRELLIVLGFEKPKIGVNYQYGLMDAAAHDMGFDGAHQE